MSQERHQSAFEEQLDREMSDARRYGSNDHEIGSIDVLCHLAVHVDHLVEEEVIKKSGSARRV